MKSWQPFQLKQRMAHTLPHDESEYQWSVNNLWSCILGNQGFVHIGALITHVLTDSITNNSTDRRQNTYSTIINVTDCKTSKKRLLAVKYLILIMFNYPTAKTRTLCKSTDGPAGRPADNPPNPERSGDMHRTVPEWTVQVCWQPGLPIWQRFGSDLDLDPKWPSRTIANTTPAVCCLPQWKNLNTIHDRCSLWCRLIPWTNKHYDSVAPLLALYTTQPSHQGFWFLVVGFLLHTWLVIWTGASHFWKVVFQRLHSTLDCKSPAHGLWFPKSAPWPHDKYNVSMLG
jgi:hypothetical protein